ncbi:MAG: sigma-70 family RNA polymerase sigma factor [Myxococcota bacterium]
MISPLADAAFRHGYGRLVALLVRRVGARHLEVIEDAVQSSLVAALESWPRAGVPDNPTAWLYRVAHHKLVGEVRRGARRGELAAEHARGSTAEWTDDAPASLSGDLGDDLLRMLFVCCDEALPVESQLVLALKTLCGFDVREIASRLSLTEANVYKRLGRARARLRQAPDLAEAELTSAQLRARLPAVRLVLYTLFTEGHHSPHPDGVIRRELCDEALRLAGVLARHPAGATPETFALVALMHLHAARIPARLEGDGSVLLDEQDRALWDPREIGLGLTWLARSAEGDGFSRYHAEAGIAAEHCLAPSLAQTRWDRIVEGYEHLERVAPSALHTVARAVALAEWRGPERGLEVLLSPPPSLEGSYVLSAVLADLHRRAGHPDEARRHREQALARAPSAAIRAALERRLGR